MWSDNVKYYLNSKELGRELVPEPQNYQDGNRAKYTRDRKGKGVLKKNSNELTFFNEAYEYLLKINTLYGVVATVWIERWSKNDRQIDQRWEMVGSYGIDIKKMKFNEKTTTVKVGYVTGGLYEDINDRFSDSFDLIETTSINGKDIGPLKTVTCDLPGKSIFLRSELELEAGITDVSPLSGGDRDGVRAVPFQIKKNPDGEFINNDKSNLYGITNTSLGFASGNFVQGQEGGITYLIADRDRTLILNGRVHFNFVHVEKGGLNFGIVKYKDGIEVNFKSFDRLFQIISLNGSSKVDYVFDNYEIDIKEGESWTIVWHHNTDDGVSIRYLEGNSLTVTEHSFAPPTECRSLTFFQVFDRLMARAFGEHGLVKSELLQSGEFSETLKTNGFWVRQFPDIVNEGTEEERRIQFKTSLKKQLESADCIMPIAWWVEKDGNKEVLRIEKLQYTQQNFVGINYGEISNGKIDHIPAQRVERTVLTDNYYASSKIGSLKSGDNYENFFGLTSFCGNADYAYVNKTESKYNKTTSDRTGDLDIEITRRKNFDKFPDEDTQMDDDIMFIDAKRTSSNRYTVRGWQDDFDSAPKNVYSPDTAFNFRYVPAQLLLNHSFVLNSGVKHYPQESARFMESNCNSSVITELKSRPKLREGENVGHRLFDEPKTTPMLIDFEMPVSDEIEKQINGFQPDGTPNWFGIVSVLINGNIEYMRLVQVDANRKGKHKMVEV